MATTDSLNGRRILIAEDEYFIANEMVRAFLASGAAIVGPVATVEEALDLIAQTAQLDGAVIDINLRGEMAYPVADALRARGVQFVFATGYGDDAIPDRYAGIVRCEKPTEPARIAQALFA